MSLSAQHRPRLLWAAALAFLAALALAGCSKPAPQFKLSDITGQMPPLKFRLHDASGHVVTQDDYRGKITLLFFGYTHCPDVCPTTLAKMAQVFKALGRKADQASLLFVTVDPQHDSLRKLKTYCAAFNPHFVPLRAQGAPLKALKQRYHVYVHKHVKPDGDYVIDHSASIYIFDRKGRIRLLASGNESVDTIAGDLTRLINGA
ncbi:MAG TPA: SCO family protein [Gammaproteobacteria bacterium]|nr:SCO family protein [Gammaproteobacteria bacterium]